MKYKDIDEAVPYSNKKSSQLVISTRIHMGTISTVDLVRYYANFILFHSIIVLYFNIS